MGCEQTRSSFGGGTASFWVLCSVFGEIPASASPESCGHLPLAHHAGSFGPALAGQGALN